MKYPVRSFVGRCGVVALLSCVAIRAHAQQRDSVDAWWRVKSVDVAVGLGVAIGDRVWVYSCDSLYCLADVTHRGTSFNATMLPRASLDPGKELGPQAGQWWFYESGGFDDPNMNFRGGDSLLVLTCSYGLCRVSPSGSASDVSVVGVGTLVSGAEHRRAQLAHESTMASARAARQHAARRAGPSSWRVLRATRSEMTGDSSIIISVVGRASRAPSWPERTPPALAVRCQEKQLEVMASVPAVLSSDLEDQATIRLKFDRGDPEVDQWNRSTSFSGMFAPDPDSVLIRLLTTDTLRLEYTPYNEGPVVATFRVSGIGRYFDRLARSCPSFQPW